MGVTETRDALVNQQIEYQAKKKAENEQREKEQAAVIANNRVNTNFAYNADSTQISSLKIDQAANDAAKEKARDFTGRESENPNNMTGYTQLANYNRFQIEANQNLKYFDPKKEEFEKQKAQATAIA